jgi:hypothetical protein
VTTIYDGLRTLPLPKAAQNESGELALPRSCAVAGSVSRDRSFPSAAHIERFSKPLRATCELPLGSAEIAAPSREPVDLQDPDLTARSHGVL